MPNKNRPDMDFNRSTKKNNNNKKKTHHEQQKQLGQQRDNNILSSWTLEPEVEKGYHFEEFATECNSGSSDNKSMLTSQWVMDKAYVYDKCASCESHSTLKYTFFLPASLDMKRTNY